jgi:hypothetical protein
MTPLATEIIYYSAALTAPLRLLVCGTSGTHFLCQATIKSVGVPGISMAELREALAEAAACNLEHRIENADGEVVYHWRAGRLIYPEDSGEFWERLR